MVTFPEMVDRLRPYRRWRTRRISFLLPVFLAALATQVWLAAVSAAPVWVRIVSLGTTGLIVALVGYFLAQTLYCARLQAKGDRVGARAFREQLVSSDRASLVAAALLAMLNTIPYLVPANPARPPLLTTQRRPYLKGASISPSPVPENELEPLPEVQAPEGPSALGPSRPDVRPILETMPLHLAVEEIDVQPDFSATLALLGKPLPVPELKSGTEQDSEELWYRPDEKHGFRLFVENDASQLIGRMGVPDEGALEDWLPPELRIDVSLLRGADRGTEVSVHLDVPITRNESIRADFAVAHFDGGDFLGEAPTDSWQRMTLAYSYRITGYTRQAPFDLSFSIGITNDRYRLEREKGRTGAGPRISPYIAIDAAIWQHGAAGVLMHAGYSIPINATGNSSGVLDLSAAVRIDLTVSISIHAGYRYMLVKLRDYEEAFSGSQSAEFADTFSGPLLGIDIRF